MTGSISKQYFAHAVVYLKHALLLSNFLCREHGEAFPADHLPQHHPRNHYCNHHHHRHHLWRECFLFDLLDDFSAVSFHQLRHP